MHLEHFARKLERLEKQRGVKSELGKPASENLISQVENNLGVSFPDKVVIFYKHLNGLRVEDPPVEILPIEQLKFVSPNRLHFATFDQNKITLFDTSKINEAKQWNIIAEDGFHITLTMPSFWSAHIWGWIERRCVIWAENLEWRLQWERIEEQEKIEKATGDIKN